ncbi:MAG: glycosyltransferase family 4 protein [Wenzhouxiangella sp.]
MSKKPKLAIGITSALSTPLITGQGRYFVQQGYNVYILGPTGGKIEEYCEEEGCTHLPVPIVRDISLLSDLYALLVLIGWMIRIRPDVVNVGTPKMGLLGSIAALLARVPRRIYTCRGLRYESESGWTQKLLILSEKISAACAQTVVCISSSVREKVIADDITKPEKTVVIGFGSSNGIEIHKFDRTRVSSETRSEIQASLDLHGAFVVGFVGRLAERKGIRELYDAFLNLRAARKNVKLVVLGVLDRSQFPDEKLLEAIRNDPDIHWVGFQDDVPAYMSTFDVLVLASWWEGFGNVLIQAAAMQVPVISTDVTGSRDAVKHDFNGVIVAPKSSEAIASALLEYYDDEPMRTRHAANGPDWAKRFDPQIIWSGLHDLYQS